MRHAKTITFLSLFLALTAGGAAAQVSGSVVSGRDLLKAGEGSLAKGEFKSAAGQLGRALRSNDLSDANVARALYQRGIAYEKSQRPAHAIADITGALFLEGLSGNERAKAYLSRGRAYEAVGMQELARSDIARAKSGGLSQSQITQSSRPAAPLRQTGGTAFSTTVREAGQRAPARNTRIASFETRARAPSKRDIPRFRTTIVPSDTPARPPATRTTPVKPAPSAPASWSTASQRGAPAPVPATGPSGQESKGRVGGFLGGLWQKTKDKVGRSDKKEAAAPPAAPRQAVPQWNQTTSGTPPQRTAAVFQTSRTKPARNNAPSSEPEGGAGYRIQLAALRSETEALATWKRLSSRHENFLGNRQPNIVRTQLGGLGTFYRVQIGPFSSKTESQELCRNFKKGGLDCFLLAP